MYKTPAEHKVTHAEYERPGFQVKNPPFRQHSDNAIRGDEANGIHHRVTQYGKPGAGHNTASVADNKNPPRDNKIRGMGPVNRETYGCPENAAGIGKAHNEFDSGKG